MYIIYNFNFIRNKNKYFVYKNVFINVIIIEVV